MNLTLHKLIEEQSFKEFREFGVHQFKFEVPPRARRLKLEASFVNEELGRANAETIAYGAYSKSDNFIKVREHMYIWRE